MSWVKENYRWLFGVLFTGLCIALFLLISITAFNNQVINNYALSDYEQWLNKRSSEIKQKLMHSDELLQYHKDILKNEFIVVQAKLGNIEHSYHKEVQDLEDAIKSLGYLKGHYPEQKIEEARKSLLVGDRRKAEVLFDLIESQNETVLAESAYQSGKLAVARFDYAKAMDRFEKSATLKPNKIKYLLDALDMAKKNTRAYATARLLTSLLKIQEEGDEKSIEILPTLNDLAGTYKYLGEYEKAQPLYERSLVISEELLGKDHYDVAILLNSLSWVYQRLGKYGQAEPLSERSLVIYEKVWGKEHLYVAMIRFYLAGIYGEQDKYEQAEFFYKGSLAIREKVLGKDAFQVATVLKNLANIYSLQGKYEQAEGLYKRCLAIHEKASGDNSSGDIGVLDSLGRVYMSQGKHEQAEFLYKGMLAHSKKLSGENDPWNRWIQARLYMSQGKYELAESLYEGVQALHEKALGERSPRMLKHFVGSIAKSLNNLAGVYKNRGKYEQAEALYLRVIPILEQKFPKGHPDLDVIKKSYNKFLKKRLNPN